MYLGMQYVLKTSDGAQTWAEISPDLTAKNPSEKASGVIQTIAPSAAQAGEIWVGTSTGLVQLTRDNGASWNNVTPPGLPDRLEIRLIEASAVDAETAYVIAAAFGDSNPYIYRTHDAGKTWQKIVTGLPESSIARVVREDPARKGLLYAGTETGAYISFDGGDHWQPLQLNLPTTSVRDLNVHGNDLVAATYGRGLWILDDLSPLRQASAQIAAGNTFLFKPANAVRVRWDNHPDTPLSADLPHGDNPPEGAIIYFYLKSPAKEITLEIRDPRGEGVRHFSSKALPAEQRPRNVPDYWFAPPDVLSANAGLNRFAWNLEWPHPDTLAYNFRGRPIDYIEYTLPDHAVAGKTPINQPPGPLAAPGRYEVVLTVDGKTYRQPLMVTLDPRVRVGPGDLEAQVDVARMIDAWMNSSYHSYNDVRTLRAALANAQKALAANSPAKEASDAAQALDKELSELQDGTNTAPGFGSVNRDVARFVTMIQSGDIRPAKSIIENAAPSCVALQNDLARWRKINAETLPALNNLLKQNKLSPLGDRSGRQRSRVSEIVRWNLMKRTRLLILLTGALCLLTAIGAINLTRSARAQQPQHTEIKIDAKLFDQYVGQYSFVDDPEFMLNFWREGEKFFMQPTNQGKIEIFAESETKFFLKIIEAQATFVRDAEGQSHRSRLAAKRRRQSGKESKRQTCYRNARSV